MLAPSEEESSTRIHALLGKEWTASLPSDVKTLYAMKKWLKAGLYSTEATPTLFELPQFTALEYISGINDFNLPEDILVWAETLGKITRDLVGREPPSWTSIDANIYVDRKPRESTYKAACNCMPLDVEIGCVNDDCLNRCTFIECDGQVCRYGTDRCMNQRFQRGLEVAELQVYHTTVRGFGLKSTFFLIKLMLISSKGL